MLFRRSTSLVDAIRLDGSEAALRTVTSFPRSTPSMRGGELEIATAHGRRVARQGSWVTRDIVTQSVRVYDDALFQAAHEPAQ